MADDAGTGGRMQRHPHRLFDMGLTTLGWGGIYPAVDWLSPFIDPFDWGYGWRLFLAFSASYAWVRVVDVIANNLHTMPYS